MAGGLRHNEGKLRFDLLPPEWEKWLAEVMTEGAKKYEPRNWEKGMDWSKCYASMRRHINLWYAGEDNDPETGLHHLAHAAWNALALITYTAKHPELDDRPNKKEFLNKTLLQQEVEASPRLARSLAVPDIEGRDILPADLNG